LFLNFICLSLRPHFISPAIALQSLRFDVIDRQTNRNQYAISIHASLTRLGSDVRKASSHSDLLSRIIPSHIHGSNVRSRCLGRGQWATDDTTFAQLSASNFAECAPQVVPRTDLKKGGPPGGRHTECKIPHYWWLTGAGRSCRREGAITRVVDEWARLDYIK